MNTREQSELKWIAGVALLALVLVSLVWATTSATGHLGGYDFDGRFYAAMAGDSHFPAAFSRVAPWCFRVLTPALVAVLPTAPLTGFVVVSFVSNVLSLVLLERILRQVGCSPRHRVLGVLLYAGTFWTLKFSFYSPAYIDHQSQLYLLLILYLTLRRAYAWLPLVLLAGALQKESLAAFSLFSLAHLLRNRRELTRGLRWVLSFALLALPALGLLAVRYWVPGVAERSAESLLVPLQLMGRSGYSLVLLQSVFSGLGLLPIVVCLRPRAGWGFLRQEWEWAVFAGLGILALLGGVDKSRLFLYLLPLMVLLAVKSVARIEERAGRERVLYWSVPLVAMQWFLGGHLRTLTWAHYLAAMLPEHSGREFLPYLWRNLALAAALVAASTPLLLGRPAAVAGTTPPGAWAAQEAEAAGGTRVDRLLASALVVLLVVGPLLLVGRSLVGLRAASPRVESSPAARDMTMTDSVASQGAELRGLIEQSRALLNQNHPREALALLQRARELGPDRVDVLINLCVAHGLLQERAPAVAACQRAAALAPASALARNNLAWVSSLPVAATGKPAEDGAAGAR